MYFRWISFICGAYACMFCIEWICLTVSGTSRIRTISVSATIAHAHGSPTRWSRRGRAQQCSSGGRTRRHGTPLIVRVVDPAAAPGVAAQQPPGRQHRALEEPNSLYASIAYCEQDGWYLQCPARSERPDQARYGADAADRRAPIARRSSRGRLRGPRRRVRRASRTPCRGRLGQPRLDDQDVVTAGRHCRAARRQSSRSCRLILFRATALPAAFGTARPSRGSPGSSSRSNQ